MTLYQKAARASEELWENCTGEHFVHKIAVSQNRLEILVLKQWFWPLLFHKGHAGVDSTWENMFSFFSLQVLDILDLKIMEFLLFTELAIS